MYREYVDANGNPRKLKFVRNKGWVVEFIKGVYGVAEEWEDESGSLIQIPSTAWNYFNIIYKDTE
jgi:hypothetical protein